MNGFWFAGLGAIGFSFKAILVKLSYPYGVDAVTLLALRMLFSLPCFALVAWREARRADVLPMTRGDLVRVGGFGIVGYYLASYLDFVGLQSISAGLERLILYTYPTLVLLISLVLYRRRISGREYVALALCYGGIAAVFAHDLHAGADQRSVLTGGAWVFASSLAYAVYLIGSGQMVGRIGAARFTAHAMIWASAVVLLQFVIARPLSALVLPWQVYGLSLAMALFSTVLPTFMVSAAVKRIGSGPVSLIGSIGPIATIFLGALMLDESLSLIQLGGAALVLAGVLLVSRARRA